MKSLIITVAGMSSRFNADTKEDVLKCLYYEDIPEKALLSLQIHKTIDLVDEIIVVGGYKFDTLLDFIRHHIKDKCGKIKTIFNDHYHDYGSGYSLLKGLEAVSDHTDDIIFIEGDLFFDDKSVAQIIRSDKDVISINQEPILSDKAVVLYFDMNHYPHYVYDTRHSCLEIREPFTAIYNSGQMWKFKDIAKVRDICHKLTPKQKLGTNLELIQQYYGNSKHDELTIVTVNCWFNCNTVSDYREAIKARCL